LSPYFERDGITIYHGDCRDVLPTLEAGSVDLVLTDPPYGVKLVTKTSDFRDSPAFDGGRSLQATVTYQDDPVTVRLLVAAVMPEVLRVGRRAVVFPGTRLMWAYPEPRAVGGVFNPNGAGLSSWGFQCIHPILYYGADPYLQDGKGGRPNGFRDEQPNPEHFDHPCPKPIKWMRWAIARASRPNELVLDPFMGSGTTLRAALDCGRRAIGIEIEERYCEIAARRLSQMVLPLALATGD
jgi:site-specific DNA-methyltransferase (adenine-specific)